MAASGTAARPYRRIATEEAWISAELLALYQKMLKEGSAGAKVKHALAAGNAAFAHSKPVVPPQTVEAGMDAAGIDMQILLLTSPGVQLLDAETAIALAAASNDQVSQAVQAHPDR